MIKISISESSASSPRATDRNKIILTILSELMACETFEQF